MIRTQRADLTEDLTPSLRPRIERNLVARLEAAAALRAHGEVAVADALPEICPYSLDQITGGWLRGAAAITAVLRGVYCNSSDYHEFAGRAL